MRYLHLVILAFLFAALPLWGQEEQSDSLKAYTALWQGDQCIESEEYEAARVYYQEALPFFRRTGRYYEQSYIYLWLSETAYYKNEVRQAMAEAQASLRLAEAHLQADTLSFYSTILQNIGLFYSRLGDFEAQMRFYQRSLVAALRCHGRQSERACDAFFSVGAAYGRRGQWGDFIAYTDTSLQIAEEIGYQGGVASALLNLSYGFAEKEDYDKAIQYQKQALARTESQEERSRGLNNLGSLYIDTGDYEKALEQLRQALELRRSQKDENFFSTLLNIARAFSEAGAIETAGRYLDEAIAGLSKSPQGNTPMLQIAYNYKARLLVRTGRAREAEAVISKAFALQGKRPDINASSCLVKGEALLARFRYSEAVDAVQQGLQYEVPGFEPNGRFDNPPWKQMERVFQGRDLLQLKGEILREWGLSSGQRPLLAASLEAFRQGDSLVTWSRNNYQSRTSRDLLAANANALYAGALHTLFHLYKETGDTAFFDLALTYVEKNKALSVLENLNGLYARSFLGIPDELVKAEQSLLEEIDFYANLLKLNRAKEADSLLAEWERQLFQKRQSQDSLLAVIRDSFPKYYNMKYGYQLAAVYPLKKELLADGETLVEYFLDEDSAFVLLLSAQQRHFYRLPTPHLAEQVALLRESAVQRADTFYTLSHELYRTLVQPLEENLHGQKLAIVPDGVLAYLPFDLLLRRPAPPPKVVRQAKLDYLLRQYSIRYLFSANSALHARRAKKDFGKKHQNILALAPIFGEGETDGIGGDFVSLPGAQAELDSLEAGFYGRFLRGERASEANFKYYSQSAAVYHIATHTDINDRLPSASRLLLHPGGGEDGQLYAYELYNLQLPAELAVLSACNTGFGTIKKGEGSASLAHAFAYAGCPNLVMSLWPVRDRATPVLIKRYYDNLADGMDKAEALRAAKIFCLEYDELFAHPYFWSGFLYLGERAPLPLQRREALSGKWATGLTVVLVLILGLIIFLRWNGLD
ncbi:MAG: CHAT domain-containing protein [Phaeodactylibacter sp.]|nr:CHAT domain-containing protein [Phaeodactylibacter sp.]